MRYFFLASILITMSCNWAKQKTKETVNKTGEVVAQAGSEFADGISKGVEKSFQNKVSFSEPLLKAGLQAGKISINSTDTSVDNLLTMYLIFDQDFNRPLTVKVFDPAGQEYGRVTQTVKATKGDARYIDFLFDRRTNIDGKGKITVE